MKKLAIRHHSTWRSYDGNILLWVLELKLYIHEAFLQLIESFVGLICNFDVIMNSSGIVFCGLSDCVSFWVTFVDALSSLMHSCRILGINFYRTGLNRWASGSFPLIFVIGSKIHTFKRRMLCTLNNAFSACINRAIIGKQLLSSSSSLLQGSLFVINALISKLEYQNVN